MKATDFDLAKDLRFDVDSGLVTLKDNRLLLFDANAIGMLRQDAVALLGREKARQIFLRFGYQNGFADFMQAKVNFNFDSETDLLASGPVIHTWKGIAKATPTEIRYDRQTRDFYFTGVWHNSFEAEQYLSFNPVGREPVCWSLVGYLSGWCSAFFRSPLIAIEPHCVGKGDEHCEWRVQPAARWGAVARPYAEALRPFQGWR